MDKKTPFKNWSKSDKTTLYFMLGCSAFFAALTTLHLHQKDTAHTVFHGACTAITAASAIKTIRHARTPQKERD